MSSKQVIVSIDKLVVVQSQPPQKHDDQRRRLFPSLTAESPIAAAAEEAVLDRIIEEAVDAALAAADGSRVQPQRANISDEPEEPQLASTQP